MSALRNRRHIQQCDVALAIGQIMARFKERELPVAITYEQTVQELVRIAGGESKAAKAALGESYLKKLASSHSIFPDGCLQYSERTNQQYVPVTEAFFAIYAKAKHFVCFPSDMSDYEIIRSLPGRVKDGSGRTAGVAFFEEGSMHPLALSWTKRRMGQTGGRLRETANTVERLGGDQRAKARLRAVAAGFNAVAPHALRAARILEIEDHFKGTNAERMTIAESSAEVAEYIRLVEENDVAA